MAQTRTITRRKLAAIGALDLAARTLHSVYSPPPPRPAQPSTFLVVEPWGIGDVVLSIPALQAVRRNFPAARISILAKSHAKELLARSGLVDDVITFDFPWTAFTGKFEPGRYIPAEFRALFRRLRERDFDVSLDARRDIRSNVVTYLGGVRRRIGYDFGGGAHLLTDVLPSGAQNDHKVHDWLALLAPLGITSVDGFAPTLTVSEGEKARARDRLARLGLSPEKTIVGIHPGASHPIRRWKSQRFADLIDALLAKGIAQVVVFEEREGDSAEIAPRLGVKRVRSNLRGFMALLSECDALVCSDSGPMHIANALGVPVTALFGPQRREWYGPRGKNDRVVQLDDMACRPCFDACIFATPRCMDGITVEDVLSSVASQLGEVAPAPGMGQV